MRAILLSICIMIAISCSMPGGESSLSVRVSMVSRQNQDSRARVLIEGSDGNLVTGSSVLLLTDSGVLSTLEFDFSSGGYVGDIPPSHSGLYELSVVSSLLSSPYSLEIPHRILQESPGIILLREDSGGSGRNALSGDKLRIGESITMAWDEVKDASVYEVRIRRDGSTVFVASTPNAVFSLAENQLMQPGMHSLQITAQYLTGDPLFREYEYYSFSDRAGSSVLFELE